LLEDEGASKNLVKLLKPHARMATVGAWIPDQVDAKRGGNKTENHVLKIEPYRKRLGKERFIADKKELLERVGTARRLARYIEEDNVLSKKWWSKPYKGDVSKPGMHLPNRSMGMSTMMKDLLLTGNKHVDALLPGIVRYVKLLDPKACTHEAAVSMYFFMLSHFLADACMPCHCDGRKLASYSGGFRKGSKKKPLHKTWESHWSRKIGTAWEKKNLLKKSGAPSADKILEMARRVDGTFGLEFTRSIPRLRKRTDIWLDTINVCRLSFAVASSVVPPKKYPYGRKSARVTWEGVFGDRPELLEELDRAILHDAVLNTAMVWKHVWEKASKH
jgi:hypothetical protein